MKEREINFNNKNFKVYLRGRADESVCKEIFELREYKDAENIIKSAKHAIIDAGAQAGFFSLYCKGLNPEVKIIAIEPDEENLESLEKHLRDNKVDNVEIISGALAGKSGLRDFFISKDSHDHSLLKTQVKNITKRVKVSAFSLADICQKFQIEKISLLKLDIEGAEYEILKNLKDDDWDKIGAIIMEYHDSAIYNHSSLENTLIERGYKIKTTISKFDSNLGFIFAHK